MLEHGASVLRLTVLWGGSVVDSFALRTAEGHAHELRVGGQLEAEWDQESRVVVLTLDGSDVAEVEPDGEARLGGFTIRCRPDFAVPHAPRPLFVDGRWLHALMVAACFQVCAVSAFLLTPAPVLDEEAGAGLSLADVERFLAVPAGGAPEEGRATFVPLGETPEEGDRVPAESARMRAPRREHASVTFRSTPAFSADDFECALGAKDSVAELKKTLGEQALDTARSEERSAGIGGLLSPRPLLEPGAGAGTVGLGESQADQLLEQALEKQEKTAQKKKPFAPKKELPVSQLVATNVQRAHVPEGEVALDPVVKDFLAQRVREHKNSVRYCYETFGLAADPGRQGRLVLELTLLPNGRVTDVDAAVEPRSLEPVASCVEEQAKSWFLGDVLPDEPKRLSFPFRLKPKGAVSTYDFTSP